MSGSAASQTTGQVETLTYNFLKKTKKTPLKLQNYIFFTFQFKLYLLRTEDSRSDSGQQEPKSRSETPPSCFHVRKPVHSDRPDIKVQR